MYYPDLDMSEAIKEINSQELKSMFSSKEDFFLIDVRESEEYEEGHINGSILIPLHVISERIKGIKQDKHLVTYCRTGRRSKTAAEMLMEMGYKNVGHLIGGYEAWMAEMS